MADAVSGEGKLCDNCGLQPATVPVRVRDSERPWIFVDEEWCEDCADDDEAERIRLPR